MKISNFKNKNGITLIALVITIIVLLILAAISITMLTGDNSILKRATDAKEKTGNAQIKERIQLAYNSALTKDITEENRELKKSTLQEELDNEFTDKSVVITESEDKKEWIISVDDVMLPVKAGKETPIVLKTIDVGAYGSKVTNYRYQTDGVTPEDWEIFYQGSVESGCESRIYLIKTKAILINGVGTLKKNNNDGSVIYGGAKEFEAELDTKYQAVKQGLLCKTYQAKGDDRGLKYYGTDDNKATGNSYSNMLSTQYLLDSTNWNEYKDERLDADKFADYVIGGPTLELLVASYNKKNSTNYEIEPPTGRGYSVSDYFSSDYIFNTNEKQPYYHGDWYWLACPANNGDENWDMRIVSDHPRRSSLGKIGVTSGGNRRLFRPVVCIKREFGLTEHTENGVTTYTIEKINS